MRRVYASGHCQQCGQQFGPRSYPRLIRDERSCVRPVETVIVRDKNYKITWVERMTCDCQWAFLVRLVDVSLLELLLPDYTAQSEIRRRAA